MPYKLSIPWKLPQLFAGVSCIALLSVAYAAEAVSPPEKVIPGEMKSLSIVKLIIKADYTSEVKVASDVLLAALAKDVKDLGYNVVGASDEGVFKAKDPNKAEMQLGGIVNFLECEDNMNFQDVSNCNIAVAWELYDTRKDKVIYKVLTRFRREVSIDDKYLESDVKELLGGAVKALLSRERFVELMKNDASPVSDGGGNAYSSATFASCNPVAVVLPADITKAQQATVVVKVGNVVGSGFVISPDGLILTAHHITSGAPKIFVRTKNGKEFEAKLVRYDPSCDAALLKINTRVPFCLSLASTPAIVGDDLYAIGAPGGEDLAFSVSKGIVSGIRDFDGRKFIQTDASINAGNSGGPLLNKNGEVVAIVSWKIVIPGFEGLGFGIPIDLIKERLAISEGSATTVEAAAAAPAGGTSGETALNDKDDPVFDSLPLTPTSVQKEWEYSFKDRHLYNGIRAPMIIGSPLLMIAGLVMILKSKVDYEMAESDWNAAYQPAKITQDEWNSIKLINTIGWVCAGSGVGVFTLFCITPKSKEKIKAEKEAVLKKGAVNTNNRESMRLRLVYTGTGLQLEGRF